MKQLLLCEVVLLPDPFPTKIRYFVRPLYSPRAPWREGLTRSWQEAKSDLVEANDISAIELQLKSGQSVKASSAFHQYELGPNL